jgi:hypothetical protein
MLDAIADLLPPYVMSDPRPARPGGRPRDDSDPAKRADQIRCALLVTSGVLDIEQAAAAYRVGTSTVYRWIERAMGYDEPEARELRKLTGRPK